MFSSTSAFIHEWHKTAGVGTCIYMCYEISLLYLKLFAEMRNDMRDSSFDLVILDRTTGRSVQISTSPIESMV